MNGVENPEFSDPLRIRQGDPTGEKIVKKGIEIHGSSSAPVAPIHQFMGCCASSLLLRRF
jgi:hypothetical protein